MSTTYTEYEASIERSMDAGFGRSIAEWSAREFCRKYGHDFPSDEYLEDTFDIPQECAPVTRTFCDSHGRSPVLSLAADWHLDDYQAWK